MKLSRQRLSRTLESVSKPQFLTTSLEVAYEGVNYEYTIEITGAGQVNVSVVSGSLPGTWTIDSTVTEGAIVISGTDHEAGGYTFTLEATNGVGTAEQEFTVGVVPAVPVGVAFTNDFTPNGTPTVEVSSVPTGATGVDFEVRLASDSTLITSTTDDTDGSWVVDVTLTDYESYYFTANSRNEYGVSSASTPTLFTVSPAAALLSNVWSFDESAPSGDVTRVDSYGGKDVTSINSVASITAQMGNAAQFVAVNSEQLTRVDETALRLGDTHFDVLVWVYIDSNIASNSNQFIVGKSDNISSLIYTEWGIYFADVSGNPRIRARISNGSTLTVLNSGLFNTTTGTWHMLVMRHDPDADTLGMRMDSSSFVTVSHTGGANQHCF